MDLAWARKTPLSKEPRNSSSRLDAEWSFRTGLKDSYSETDAFQAASTEFDCVQNSADHTEKRLKPW